MRIRHISTRLALVMAASALVPLVAFGTWAFLSLQAETKRAAIEATLALADREAGDMSRDLARETATLAALADDLQKVIGSVDQQLRILDLYIMRFPVFRGLTVLDARDVVLSSRGSAPARRAGSRALGDTGVQVSPVAVGEDLVASAVFALPIGNPATPSAWVVADVTFDNLWNLVEDLRVGQQGHALLLDVDGRVIADGQPGARPLLPEGTNLASHPLFRSRTPAWREYVAADGEERLTVASAVTPAGWLLLVEQPTSEAFAPARRLGRQLTIAAAAAAFFMLVAGVALGRRTIAPVHALERATQALAAGNFDARVSVDGSDEFARLGESFNAMADRLVTLQNEIKVQERQVMFGRVVAGLFHDLSQPIQALGNGVQLLLRHDLDEGSRESLRQTLERELEALRHFMDDMLNVARPAPIDRTLVDVNAGLFAAVEAMRGEADTARVVLTAETAGGAPCIDADAFALGRVYRNLIANALQATSPGGRVVLAVQADADIVQIQVVDTGSGIAPARLPTLFEDFATTKRRGLGLGLATSRRLVEQLGGTIAVTSRLGEGTTFTLRFPARQRPAVQVAS